MIFDSIAGFKLYTLPEPFCKAFEHSLVLDARAPEGRTVLQGDELYAGVSEYDTIPENKGKYEAHRQYADIQIVLSGREKIKCRPAAGLEVSEPYDRSRDVEFYRHSDNPGICEIELVPGVFAVFFPWDAHMPQIVSHGGGRVKKVVYKVDMRAFEKARHSG